MKDCSQLDKLDEVLRRKLWGMRYIILPGLREYQMSASFGIFSPKRDVKAAIAYDMQQEFRYRRAWYLNPNGGYTVDFGKPLPCEDDPCEFPKADCYDSEGEFRIKVYVDDTQLKVMIDALKVIHLGYLCQVEKLFRYYTDNAEALKIAAEITDLLASVEADHAVNTEQYSVLNQRLEMVMEKE